MTRVVLGSASPGRLRVLRQAGVDPLVVVSGVDERAIIAGLGHAASADVVCALARAKAEQVMAGLDHTLTADCLVIGCDSMLEVDGRLVGKPRSVAQARALWQSMAGRSGRLHTGHCLLRLQEGAVTHREVDSATTTVYFADPTAVSLDTYIDSGEPLHAAGGFTIDGLGGWFVDRIEGDPSNVIGLSLPLTRKMLGRVGLPVAALW